MALANLILETGQQQANYGAAVGQSLVALGQQVGQQLATREYQRQAQAALPALQQTYSSALDKIEAGDVSAGYRDLMNAQLQFGTTQNPFLTTINDRASKLAEDAANNVMKTRLYEMQYGGRGGGGTTLPAMTGAEVARQRAQEFVGGAGGEPPPTGVNFNKPPSGVKETALSPDEEAAANLPTTQEPQLPPSMEPIVSEATAFRDKPVQEKVSYAEQAIVANPPEKGYEPIKVKGLDKYYGVSEIFIPSVGTRFEQSLTVSGSTVTGEARETIAVKPIEVGKEQFESAKNTIKTAEDAASRLQRSRPVGAKDTLENIIANNGGIQLFDVQPNNGEIESDTERFPDIMISAKTGEQFPLTADQSKDVRVIQSLPTLTGSTGARFGEGATLVGKPKEEAPAAPATQERFPVKQGAAQPAAQPTAAPARELTLEERIAAKTTTAAPTRTATREQIAGVKAGKVRQQRSTLESEKTRLERSLYETPRAGGGRKLKRGLTAQDPDVKAALDRIAAINKQLEAL